MATIPRFSSVKARQQVSNLGGLIGALIDNEHTLESVANAAIVASTLEHVGRRALQNAAQAGASMPLGMALARDLTATGGAASGGALIGSDRFDLQTTLRPFSSVVDAGVRVVEVPEGMGNGGVPVVTGDPTAQWASTEQASPTESDSVFGLANVLPRRLSLTFFVSYRLAKMGGQFLQAGVYSQFGKAFGRALDAGVLGGVRTGDDGQPQGIATAAGVNAASGTSLAHAALLEMRAEALTGGAREDALRWIGTPAVQQLLGARERSVNSGRYLWDDGAILGRPAHATGAAPASTLIAGDFSRVTLYLYPDVDVIVDKRFLSTGGKYRVTAHLFADVAVTHPAAFSVASSIT